MLVYRPLEQTCCIHSPIQLDLSTLLFVLFLFLNKLFLPSSRIVIIPWFLIFYLILILKKECMVIKMKKEIIFLMRQIFLLQRINLFFHFCVFMYTLFQFYSSPNFIIFVFFFCGAFFLSQLIFYFLTMKLLIAKKLC